MNILSHIQLAQYQINMRFDKTSNMLFLNDLNSFRFDKDSLLRSAFSQKVDDDITKTLYIRGRTERILFN